MSVSTQVLQVSPLRGMDDRYVVAPNRATLIRDMTWSQRDGWSVSGGAVRATPDYDVEGETVNGFDSYPVIKTLHWFSQNEGATQWLLWEDANGLLRYFNGSRSPSTPWTNVRDIEGRSFVAADRKRTVRTLPWAGTMSVAYGGRLYLVNGVDEPLVFDGTKVRRAGFAHPPSAPDAFLVDVTGGGANVPLIDYDAIGLGAKANVIHGKRYKVTFLNEDGQESPASEASGLVTFTNTTSGRWPVAVQIPKGPPGTVARRVWASLNTYDTTGHQLTQGAEANFYLHSEVQDNMTEIIFDIRPDTVLGTVLVENNLGPWPASGRHPAVFKNTMFLWTEEGVVYSRPSLPEVFPVDNFLPCGSGSAGPGTGFYATRNALVAFRKQGVFLIRGDPTNGFFAEPLTYDVGCAAPRSILEVPGLGVWWLSEDGVFLLEGALENSGTPTSVRQLSLPVSDQMARINKGALANASATVNRRDKEAWLAVPVLGENSPNLVLVYHYEIGEWSIRPDYPISCMVTTGDHRQYVIYGSHDSSRPGLWIYTHASRSKGGAFSVSGTYETANLNFGTHYRGARILRVMAHCIGYGAGDIIGDLTLNRGLTTALEAAVSRDQAYLHDLDPDDTPSEALSQWGTAVLDGSATWAEHRPVVVRMDVNLQHATPAMEARIHWTWGGTRGQIIGYEVEVQTGGRRSILPLSQIHGGPA